MTQPEVQILDSPHGRLVSGAVLRLLLALVAAVTIVVPVVSAGAQGFRLSTMAAMSAVVLGAMLLPGSQVPTVLALIVVVVHVVEQPAVWTALPSGVLLYATHLLAAWCAVVAPRARVEVAALAPSARRVLVVTAACLPVALVAVVTADSMGSQTGVPSTLAAGVVVGGAAVGLAVLMRRAVGRPPT